MPVIPDPATPTPALTMRVIEDALHDWFAVTSGLGAERVWWQDGEVVRSTFPFGTLRWLSKQTRGIDAVGVEDLGQVYVDLQLPDVRLWASGVRSMVLSVQVFTDPKGAPEVAALTRLDSAVASLSLPTRRQALIAAGFGLVSVGSMRMVAPGQAAVDITCTVASNISEDTYSIGRATLTPEPDLDVIEPFDVET